MKLQIKILNGKDCVIEVDPQTGVREVKKQVETKLGVPVTSQRLVFRGKPLADERTVGECGLSDNTKLFLVVKKVEEASSSQEKEQQPHLWTELGNLLRRHFREDDARRVLDEFRKDFYGNMANLSLDDIERLATAHLESVSS